MRYDQSPGSVHHLELLRSRKAPGRGQNEVGVTDALAAL